MLSDLKTFVMFVGYPRSGHSIVGALLDAHRRIVVCHEANVLALLAAGAGRNQIFHRLLRNSRRWNRKQSGYSYRVPGLYQGDWTKLEVIGDKKGGASALQLADRPELLRHLRETVMTPLKIIHVVRHPLDTIATLFHSPSKHYGQGVATVKVYRKLVHGVLIAREQTAPENFLTVYHEDLLARPKEFLKGLCEFVDQQADDTYLDRCASIVWTRPHLSRGDAAWSQSAVHEVRRIVRQTDYLRRYERGADQWSQLPMR